MKSNLFLVLVQFHLFTGYACRGLTPSNLDQCSWCKMVQLTLHLIGLCAETVHLALQSGVSGAAELCSVCRTPPPSPPCRQERYEAATVAMVFQGEHVLQSVSPHHSILGSKNEAFLCLSTDLVLFYWFEWYQAEAALLGYWRRFSNKILVTTKGQTMAFLATPIH